MNREVPQTLGVDSGTVAAFKQEWNQFKGTRPWAFLVLHLEVKIRRAARLLETTPLESVEKVQSEIATLRSISEMIRRNEIPSEIEDVLLHTKEKINK